MRVITWNMAMGPGRRKRRTPGLNDRTWHYLLGLGPDLAFLQESLPPPWVRGEGSLMHGPFNEWGSVIFSPRYPLWSYHLPDGHHLRRLGTYLAFARVDLPDGSQVFATSVHARSAPASQAQLDGVAATPRARSSKGPMVNDVILAGLTDLVGEEFIVAGDWNTARRQRDSAAGQAFFDQVRDRRWFDCTWDTLEDEVRTWFGDGTIAQDDYVFCSQRLGELVQYDRSEPDRTPWASAEAVRLGLSDHAPLIVDFKVEPIAMTNL